MTWSTVVPQWQAAVAYQDISVVEDDPWEAEVYARITSDLNNAVAYLETIRKKALGEEKYVKQTAGKNQYGHVVLEVLPFNGNGKFKFKNKAKSGLIPKEFLEAIEAGIKESMDIGIIAGFPITNVEVVLLDGSFHDEDSSELSFKIAASLAFQKAIKHGEPILLEPMMKIEILVQDEYLGEVINDFNSREGKITKMDTRNNLHIVAGLVPLSNMFGYATTLRTLSQGRANYTMEFFDYIEMSDDKMKDVLKNQLGIYQIN
jgi:elongation factor G